jgi:hypothetical protein
MSDLRRQYKDSSNLNARMAIYGFGAEGGFGPAQVLGLMLKAIPADAGSGGRLRARLDVEKRPRPGAGIMAHAPH